LAHIYDKATFANGPLDIFIPIRKKRMIGESSKKKSLLAKQQLNQRPEPNWLLGFF